MMASQETAAVAVASGVGLVALLPEYWPVLLLSGFVAGLLRALHIMGSNSDKRVWEAALGMFTSLSSSFFLWPAMQGLFEPTFGRLDMEPIVGVLFGSFIAGLIGVALIGAFLDWRAPKQLTGKRGNRNDL